MSEAEQDQPVWPAASTIGRVPPPAGGVMARSIGSTAGSGALAGLGAELFGPEGARNVFPPALRSAREAAVDRIMEQPFF